jgi:hypothetical protein
LFIDSPPGLRKVACPEQRRRVENEYIGGRSKNPSKRKISLKAQAFNTSITILGVPKLYFCAADIEIFRNLFVSLAFFVSFLGNAKKKKIPNHYGKPQ